MIGAAFTIRNASDYDDMFLASRADTEQQIQMQNMFGKHWQSM